MAQRRAGSEAGGGAHRPRERQGGRGRLRHRRQRVSVSVSAAAHLSSCPAAGPGRVAAVTCGPAGARTVVVVGGMQVGGRAPLPAGWLHARLRARGCACTRAQVRRHAPAHL